MKIEQIYTGCLAQGAYYILSEGEAVIIDPLREVGPYMEKAKKDGATIKYVLETHFHADFVSGHLDLAAKTGATIVYGPNANPTFDAHIAEDGEELIVENKIPEGAPWPELDEEPQLSSPGVDPDMIQYFAKAMGDVKYEEPMVNGGAAAKRRYRSTSRTGRR